MVESGRRSWLDGEFQPSKEMSWDMEFIFFIILVLNIL